MAAGGAAGQAGTRLAHIGAPPPATPASHAPAGPLRRAGWETGDTHSVATGTREVRVKPNFQMFLAGNTHLVATGTQEVSVKPILQLFLVGHYIL